MLSHQQDRKTWHDTWHKRFGRKRGRRFLKKTLATHDQTRWKPPYCDTLNCFVTCQTHHTQEERRKHQQQKISFHNRRSYSRVALPASRRRTFQPNLNSANQNRTSKSSCGNVKNIAATEWLARQGRHRPSCTAKHLAFEIDLFKFNMAERNQFQASAPTISKPKTASYLKPFLASRNTFHFQ